MTTTPVLAEPVPPLHEARANDLAVARAVKACRRACGFTQTRLAQALGITFQQVQKYENATNRVSAGRLQQIAKILGMPVTSFYLVEDENAAREKLAQVDLEIGSAAFNMKPDARRSVLSIIRAVIGGDSVKQAIVSSGLSAISRMAADKK